ncbi:hypothetical protein RFI_07478 [Reticulomyxa filosa]|uniref:BZIP domain-containing protein n=1 Tax=Reticulomyxa filosa TaxID=46433 RepID=X6NWI2_RETFI|nr:hypothetical protein RFI_07478 [Reticulomyxa filosa]|eukprot:ETO29642.1 hypothetical protein RFI_07478 [Reticulomyxa filosa]
MYCCSTDEIEHRHQYQHQHSHKYCDYYKSYYEKERKKRKTFESHLRKLEQQLQDQIQETEKVRTKSKSIPIVRTDTDQLKFEQLQQCIASFLSKHPQFTKEFALPWSPSHSSLTGTDKPMTLPECWALIDQVFSCSHCLEKKREMHICIYIYLSISFCIWSHKKKKKLRDENKRLKRHDRNNADEVISSLLQLNNYQLQKESQRLRANIETLQRDIDKLQHVINELPVNVGSSSQLPLSNIESPAKRGLKHLFQWRRRKTDSNREHLDPDDTKDKSGDATLLVSSFVTLFIIKALYKYPSIGKNQEQQLNNEELLARIDTLEKHRQALQESIVNYTFI